ncbi:MAG: transcriptional repressor [Firmicutes bacterium]|nr:transcriptional repressor [Bacillota bacterium]
MATYNTQQKQNLIDFLKKYADRAFTIDDIVEGMKSDSAFINPPGKSTIYRLMPGLTEKSIVKCFAGGRGSKATYQIIGGDHCHHHMHMKCTGCGRLLHMDDHESGKLMAQVKAFSHFDIDLSQTLLFGRCEGCVQKGSAPL